jgi:hypothetical protein
MQRAFREAKRWQHDFVGTEHLLFGLLCDAYGPAAGLLRSLQFAPDSLLAKVELSLQRHDGGMAMEQFPLSPASKRVFQFAAEEAGQFRHQMIGPEHLLLGLLRERDCEAAQILSANGIAWDAVRNAVAQLPPDAYREAQILAAEQSPVPLGDNPSAADLERWIAPMVRYADEPVEQTVLPAHEPLPPVRDVEAQVRRTQFVLAAVLGYAFGHWLSDWALGLFLAGVGVVIVAFGNSWAGIIVGACCGLFLTPIYHDEMRTPLYPVLIGMLGALLGSFLGDGWRFTIPMLPPEVKKEEPASPDDDKDRIKSG